MILSCKNNHSETEFFIKFNKQNKSMNKQEKKYKIYLHKEYNLHIKKEKYLIKKE